MIRFRAIIRLCILLTVFLSLNLYDSCLAYAKTRIIVSIAPIKYFVERISGEKSGISVLASETSDPHSYEPKPGQLIALSRGDIFFTSGLEFEKILIAKIKKLNPGLRIVDLHKSAVQTEKSEEIDYNEPHFWTSPRRVIIAAEAISRSLSEIDPSAKDTYQNNLKNFRDELLAFDRQIVKELTHVNRRCFMVFHPAWSYLADDYNLEQIAVEEHGKNPGPARLKNILKYAKQNNIKVIFIQPQLSVHKTKEIAGMLKADIVKIDPMASDWFKNLRYVVAEIIKSLK